MLSRIVCQNSQREPEHQLGDPIGSYDSSCKASRHSRSGEKRSLIRYMEIQGKPEKHHNCQKKPFSGNFLFLLSAHSLVTLSQMNLYCLIVIADYRQKISSIHQGCSC